MTKQYEKDPINDKFYPKAEDYLTDEQWLALKKRWEPKKTHKYSLSDKISFWTLGFIIFYMVAQWIRVLL